MINTIKLFPLILILLITTTVQSCLKKSSSITSSTEEKIVPIYYAYHIHASDFNSICQYRCPIESLKEETYELNISNCDKYVAELPSDTSKRKNIMELVKTGGVSGYVTDLKTDDIQLLLDLNFNKYEEDECNVSSSQLVVLNKTTLSILEEKIDDTWKAYKDQDGDISILYNLKTHLYFIKGYSSLNYNEAVVYCNNLSTFLSDSGWYSSSYKYNLISQNNFLSLKSKIKYFNFKNDDCIWVDNNTTLNQSCYLFQNMYPKAQDETIKNLFLCQGTDLKPQAQVLKKVTDR